MTKPAPLTGFDVANAAQTADQLIASRHTPTDIQKAVAAAGFGPHDAWPHAIAESTVAALKDFADNPKTGRAAWIAEHANLLAAPTPDRNDLAKWLVAVGDPAWQAIDAVKTGAVAERIATARGQLTQQVVAATYDAVVAAAQRAADHHAATVDEYAADDAALETKFAEEKIASDVQNVARQQVADRRRVLRIKAMWPTT